MTYPAFALPLYCSETAITSRRREPALYYVIDACSKNSSALFSTAPSDIPAIVHTSLAFYQAVARVLPVDEEADRRIDALIARQPRRAGRRPVARR